jgi:MFS family permease
MNSPVGNGVPMPDEVKAAAVLRNRPFLLLWLSQLATQVGGNMVLYSLTISINASYGSAAVSGLFVSFLVPAIVFSAIAGVFVDRADKRHILLITNILRGIACLALVLVGNNLLLIYVLMAFVATVTTFFAPAEASMIPLLVSKNQLLSANGFFTLTMNIAFVAGFALFGPILLAVANTQVLIVVVAALYLTAAVFCWTLPPAPRSQAVEATAGQTVLDAERAVSAMFSQFLEGISYIRSNRSIGWSLSYLVFSGALVGILGVIGPNFAKFTLALGEKDFALIVMPMGLGIMMGILVLNSYGRYLPRRRTIESGMILVGILLAVLAWVGPISHFLEAHASSVGLAEASRVVSLLSMVMGLAFFIGAAYVIVAISAQTQLQEELHEDVRGRVFGILNMLVSIGSLVPLIIVGPVADLVGREPVIFGVGIIVCLWGLTSAFSRGSRASDDSARAPSTPSGAPVDLLTVAISPSDLGAEAGPAAAAAQHRVGPGHVVKDGKTP